MVVASGSETALEHYSSLSEVSRRRIDEGAPLRVLDSKDAADVAVSTTAPTLLDFASDATRQRFSFLCYLERH